MVQPELVERAREEFWKLESKYESLFKECPDDYSDDYDKLFEAYHNLFANKRYKDAVRKVREMQDPDSGTLIWALEDLID